MSAVFLHYVNSIEPTQTQLQFSAILRHCNVVLRHITVQGTNSRQYIAIHWKMESKVHYSPVTLKKTPFSAFQQKVNQRTLISASQQLMVAGVLCQCLSLMMGKSQSSLMWRSAPQPSLSVLKPTRHKCRLKARVWYRHPIKAPRTLRFKLSQLGCICAQIFEKCLVQLAEHHSTPCPKNRNLRAAHRGGEVVERGSECWKHDFMSKSRPSTFSLVNRGKFLTDYVPSLSTGVTAKVKQYLVRNDQLYEQYFKSFRLWTCIVF